MQHSLESRGANVPEEKAFAVICRLCLLVNKCVPETQNHGHLLEMRKISWASRECNVSYDPLTVSIPKYALPALSPPEGRTRQRRQGLNRLGFFAGPKFKRRTEIEAASNWRERYHDPSRIEQSQGGRNKGAEHNLLMIRGSIARRSSMGRGVGETTDQTRVSEGEELFSQQQRHSFNRRQ